MATSSNSGRVSSVAALAVTLVALVAQRSPWMTSSVDINPAVQALVMVILPLAAVALGVYGMRSTRRQPAATGARSVLAWAGLLLPAGWLTFQLLFLLGELLIGHS